MNKLTSLKYLEMKDIAINISRNLKDLNQKCEYSDAANAPPASCSLVLRAQEQGTGYGSLPPGSSWCRKPDGARGLSSILKGGCASASKPCF